MKLVIIESPYKGNVKRNLRYLRSCIRDCIRRGESPYASHRMLTDALDDNNPEERMLGIEAGLAWRDAQQPIRRDDGLIIGHESVKHVFYVDLGSTEGMLFAKKRYDDEGVPYEGRNLPPDDPFFAQDEEPSETWHFIGPATRTCLRKMIEERLGEVEAEGPLLWDPDERTRLKEALRELEK